MRGEGDHEEQGPSSRLAAARTTAVTPPSPPRRWRLFLLLQVLHRLEAAGHTANMNTFVVLVPCLVRSKNSQIAVEMLDKMRTQGIALDARMCV